MSCVGDRVGAILSGNKDTVKFLGFGVYEGDFLPREAVGNAAEAMVRKKIVNPMIKLDSGDVVYGCECWWGTEKSIQNELDRFDKIEHVDIKDVRNDYTSDN